MFLAAWIYCAVTWGFLFGFFVGWIPALVLGLLVAVATIYLWPLVAAGLFYVIFRFFGIHPRLLIYIAAFIAIFAITIVWWWHLYRNRLD